MEDQVETDAEDNSRLPSLEDAEDNEFYATEEGAAAPFAFPICVVPGPQLNQPKWFQTQDAPSPTSEVSLYAGLPDPAPPTTEEEEGGSLHNLLVLSLGFFLIFSASNTLGEFVPSVLPDGLGDQSMLLNSFVQSLAVFGAPGVVATAGEARSMALAALAYVIYIGSLITSLPLAVLAASALLGLGSSVVWVAQGSFLTRCCPPKLRGAYSGVFYCFYFASNILGNIGAYYAFRSLPLQSMFSIFAMVAMLGVFVLLQLTEFPVAVVLDDSQEFDVGTDLDGIIVDDLSSSGYEELDSDVEGEHEAGVEEEQRAEEPDAPDDVSVEFCPSSVIQRDHSLGGLRSRVTTLLIYSLLAPVSFYTGFEGAFWSGQFTKLLPPESIGLVLAATGVGEVIGALGLGLVSDSLGRRAPTFVVGSLLFLYGLYWCIPLYEAANVGELLQPTLFGAPVVAYVSSFAFGMGDGVFSGHMFAMISSLFSPEDLEAWALFNLLGTLGSASAYAYGIAAPLVGPQSSVTQVWTQAGSLIIGTILYVVVDTLVVTWQRPESAEDPKKNM